MENYEIVINLDGQPLRYPQGQEDRLPKGWILMKRTDPIYFIDGKLKAEYWALKRYFPPPARDLEKMMDQKELEANNKWLRELIDLLFVERTDRDYKNELLDLYRKVQSLTEENKDLTVMKDNDHRAAIKLLRRVKELEGNTSDDK